MKTFVNIKREKRRSIATRIAVSVVITTILTTLALSFLVSRQFEKALKEEAERNLSLVLEREAQALNDEFDRVKGLTLALRNSVLYTLDLDDASDRDLKVSQKYMDAYKEQLAPLFKAMIVDFRNISGWVLFNSRLIPGTNTLSYTYEGGTFKREPEYDVVGGGYENDPWWKEAIKRGEHWTTPYYWAPWDADIISYSMPVVEGDKLIGVVGAEFFMKPFQDRLRQIQVYDTGFIMLISNEGQQVYLPKEANPDKISAWYRANTNNLLAQSQGISYIDQKSVFDQTILAWHKLDNGWLLIAQPNTEEMYGALRNMYWTIGMIILLSVPCSILVGILLGNGITKRLSILTQAAKKLMDHHNSEIDLIDIPGHDEIYSLSVAFNRMQTEIRQSLKDLKYSEAKYRSLVENSEHMIFTLDLQGKLLTTNKSLEMLVGQIKEDLQGQHFSVLFTQESTRLFWQEVFNQMLLEPKRIIKETRVESLTFGSRQLITTLLPIFDEKHQILMIMGTAIDITERILADQEIKRLLEQENTALSVRIEEKAKDLEIVLKELMEADKLAALGRLVAGIAHEMNTPLGNAITLSSYIESQLLMHQEILNTDVIEACTSLQRSLNKTVALVDHFKGMRVSTNVEGTSQVLIQQLLTMTLNSLSKVYATQNIHVEINCPDNMEVNTSPAALAQVLTHLIENVYVHSYKWDNGDLFDMGQDGPKMFIDVQRNSYGISIAITDNGTGMDEEKQKHVFEPFYTTKRGQGSTGLGLSIVYNIVTGTLNGRIHVNSNPYPNSGHGSTFTVYLPMNDL